MYKRKLEKDIRCPLEYGLSMFTGKWKSRILCVLACQGARRYSELVNDLGNITDAVLSASLKELVADNMIKRILYEEIPPRVEYELTSRGESVLPILQSIAQWAGGCKREIENEESSPYCKKCDYHT